MRKNLLLTPKEASPWRVFAEVARKHSMTSMGVMRICQRNGNYKTRTEK